MGPDAAVNFVLREFAAPFSPLLVRIVIGLAMLAAVVLVFDGGAVL
jgi:hypothetical protein